MNHYAWTVKRKARQGSSSQRYPSSKVLRRYNLNPHRDNLVFFLMRSLRLEEYWSAVWRQISRFRSEIRAPCYQSSCHEQKHRKEWKCYHQNPRARLRDPTSDLERHHQHCRRLHRQDCRRPWGTARGEKSKWLWVLMICRKLILRLQIRSRNSLRNFGNIKKVVTHPLQ